MEQKETLLPADGNTQRHRLKTPRRFWTVVLIATIAFFGVEQFLRQHFHYKHRRNACYHHVRHFTYEGELITWEACGEISGRPLECSRLDVPMDQFNATNSGDKTFNIPLIRLRGLNATQSLLLNPGGPGGSGMDFMYRWGKQLADIIGDGFHLLSFDPRGINGSQPAARCYLDAAARREHPGLINIHLPADSGELYARAHNLVRACADIMGEHGLYINTPQTAADMNSILDAIGQSDMAYWGFSYGTILGQTYATLFPERSRRIIIDGVVNQFDWYESKFDDEALTDTEKVFDGFLHECVQAGSVKCGLAALGDSEKALFNILMSLADELRDDPLPVYVNRTSHGLLYRATVLEEAIFPALYRPAQWHQLSANLVALIQGNPAPAFSAYAPVRQRFWDSEGDAYAFVAFNDGISGPTHWQQGRRALQEEAGHFWNQTLFSGILVEDSFRRQQWPVPKTHMFAPRGHDGRDPVSTAYPLLILSTSLDPICPLLSARSAKTAFQGSRMVEVKGYGHCSIAVPSVCVARHVRAFLYEGHMPDEGAQCEVDGPFYFAEPSKANGAVAMAKFVDAEDLKIHLAQLELAQSAMV